MKCFSNWHCLILPLYWRYGGVCMELIDSMNIETKRLKTWNTAEQLFPDYGYEDYQSLKEFIANHGQPNPITVEENSLRIVDGYCRYRLFLKEKIPFVDVQIYKYKNEKEMEIHAIALNAKRRHLDSVAMARAAKKLSKLYAPSKEQIRKKISEGTKRAKRGSRGTQGRQLRQSSIEKAALEVGVSKNSVRMVAKVDKSMDAELIKAMEDKQISIKKAYELSFLNQQERIKYLKKTVEEAQDAHKKATGMLSFVQGDARTVLKELPSKSVYTCITSPPYWGLRDYGVEGQLGLEPSPEEYVQKLVEIFREVRRTLKDEGTVWLNLGDSYCRSGQSQVAQKGIKAGKNSYSYGFQHPKAYGSKLKHKDLVGIPWMVAFALRNDGWFLRSDIIWNKPNTTPESVKDRPTQSHEYIFLLSKSERYYYDYDSVKERAEGAKHFDSDEYRNKRSVWTVKTKPFKDAHFAVFPEHLIEPCIKAGCPEGGTVLDPFAGSGTTGITSQKLGRNCILIDINEDYVKLQKKRTKDMFFTDEDVDLERVRKIVDEHKE